MLAIVVVGSAACLPSGATESASPAPSNTVNPSSPHVSTPLATPSLTARPQPTVSILPPLARGALPEAGVVVVRDGFGSLYRYDGATGRVEPVISFTGWTFARQTASGLYAIGLQGGVVFVPWSGAPQIVTCGGVALAISATGACASRRYGPDGGLYVQYPGAAPLRILPPDWGAGQIAWDPSSRRLALTRTVDQRCVRCPNALYVITPDGSPRLLYDTHVDETHFGPLGAVARVLWSPAGDLIAASLSTGCAGCDSSAGNGLLVIDPASDRAIPLGVTPEMAPDIAWSANGDLAFVSGTLERLADSELKLRRRDGSITTIDPRGSRPAWSAAGDRLAWVRGDGSAAVVDLAGGDRRPIRCADGDVAGIRFNSSGEALLLLCRLPGSDLDRYSIRYVASGRDTVVLEQVGGTLAYAIGPDFFDLAAWSRGPGRE